MKVNFKEMEKLYKERTVKLTESAPSCPYDLYVEIVISKAGRRYVKIPKKYPVIYFEEKRKKNEDTKR